MNFEKLTDRSKGFFQSAQSLALREGHQRLAPEHLLKVLLDDSEGLAAGLVMRGLGRPPRQTRSPSVEQALAKMPKVSGAGAGQLYIAPPACQGSRPGGKDRREGRRQLRDR